MNLTGTKIEHMMRNNKAVQMERGSEKHSLPQMHPCYGCSYAKESGVSYRITCNNGNQRTLRNP